MWIFNVTMWVFDNIENKHSLYHGEDFIEKFCISLKEHEANVTNFLKRRFYCFQKKS